MIFKKEDNGESNEMFDKFLSILMIAALGTCALVIFLMVTNNVADSAEQQLNSRNESRHSLVSEEINVPLKNIIENKPMFKSYYEYTTSEGNYRVVFDKDFTDIVSIVEIQ